MNTFSKVLLSYLISCFVTAIMLIFLGDNYPTTSIMDISFILLLPFSSLKLLFSYDTNPLEGLFNLVHLSILFFISWKTINYLESKLSN